MECNLDCLKWIHQQLPKLDCEMADSRNSTMNCTISAWTWFSSRSRPAGKVRASSGLRTIERERLILQLLVLVYLDYLIISGSFFTLVLLLRRHSTRTVRVASGATFQSGESSVEVLGTRIAAGLQANKLSTSPPSPYSQHEAMRASFTFAHLKTLSGLSFGLAIPAGEVQSVASGLF
jgi:hypothetical protein